MNRQAKFISRCRFCISSSTRACTETSSALVGSSAISTCGFSDSARAMPTRCFWPPESSCGKRLRYARGSSTLSRRRSTSLARSAPFSPLARRSGSAIESEICSRGFSDDDGSWNTMPTLRCSLRISSRPALLMSWPATTSFPEWMGSRPIAARPRVVLPEPDSPTSPTTSPSWIFRSMSLAARKAGTRPCFGYSIATSWKSTTTTPLVHLGFRVLLGRDALVDADALGVLLLLVLGARREGRGGVDLLVLALTEVRDRIQQRDRVRVLRRGEDLRHGARLDDVALAHHDDVVGQVGDDAHVVGDEQDGAVEPVAEAAQQLQDLGLHGDVEGGRRLVGDEELRVARDRLGDHRALALAAGELVRVRVVRLHAGRAARPSRGARVPAPSPRAATCRSGCAGSRRSANPRCRRGSARSSAPGR